MAGLEMSLASEHVQRLLQCAVCLERFRQPKLLPCQHTFCLSPCLEHLVDHRTRSIRCPECRADHFVPRRGVSSYPNNLTVIGFLELSGQAVQAAEEGENDGNGPPAWSTAGESADQRIMDPQRAASPPREPVHAVGAEGGGCFVCSNDGLIIRCSHCDNLVCRGCHQAHIQQVKADVTRSINRVRRGLPCITEQIVAVGRKRGEIQNNCESVRAEVIEAVDKHIRELKARERTLRGDIDSFQVGELRAIQTHQENSEVEFASLASFCDSAESLLSTNRPVPGDDLMEVKRQCEEHLETLQCYRDGTIQRPSLRHLQTSLESPFLTSTIGSFGDLIVTFSGNHQRGLASDSSNDQLEESRDSLSVAEGTQSRSSATSSLRLAMLDSEFDDSFRGPGGSGRTSMPPLPAIDGEGMGADYTLSREQDRRRYPTLQTRSARAESNFDSVNPLIQRRQLDTSRPIQARLSDESPSGADTTNSTRAMTGERRAPGTRHSHHRRRREERHSDTYLTMGRGRSLALSQMRDRARHLSLGSGTLPRTAEHSDNDLDSSSTRVIGQSSHAQALTTREEEFGDDFSDRPSSPVELSSTYPGARTHNRLSPPVRFEVALNGSDPERDTDSPRLHNCPDSPSVYLDSPRNRYNQKGAVLVRFGHRGNGAKCFTWPRGVVVSPLTENIFVADSSNHRIQVFNNVGKFLQSFGRYGQGEGEFDCLAGIAINGLGQIIIADRCNHRIQVLDRNGAFNNAFGSEGSGLGQLSYPWGIACDSMGFIYVCDKENHRIQVFQSNGTFVRTFGQLGTRDGQFENPHYIAISADNRVYVCDSSNHRVQVFSMYGDFLFAFGTCGAMSGQMKFPRGLAVDAQGFVVVADSGNNRLQVFRGDGRFYTMFGSWGSESGQFRGLEGVGILANGNVVVSDRENHRIQIF